MSGRTGIVETLHRIYVDEGVRGWYRGLTPTLVGYLPTWAIYFVAYEHFKTAYRTWLGAPWPARALAFPRQRLTVCAGFASGAAASGHCGPGPDATDITVHVLGAVSAGAVSTVSTNPLWVIKTRMMARASGFARAASRPAQRGRLC